MKTGFLAVSLILAVLSGGSLPAQEPAAGAPDASRGKIEPVFPVENENLVFVEGEEAVSTNFAREPVLSYSCSGERTLQLNRAGGLEGVGSYYADYAFSAQSAGTYELWYGGTPPGPRDDLYPSYASPFQVTFDEGKKIPVYRETVAVVGDYSPAYYWSYIGDVAIESGSHRVRFEVTEKRRVDGRYFFYLDCFFLVKKEAGRRLLAPPLPEVFPPNLDDRSRNTPFSAVDDYLIRVRDAPGSVEPYVELSKVYTMLGDYLNALKYLNRAALLEPANSQVLLLAAKNRIWKGDVAEGLKKYRELLAKEPMRRDLWNEAGKVAAWMGRYDESVDFYAGGLASFPKDPDLMVNLSLTLLWAGRVSEAERTAREVEDLAGSDGRLLVQLGRIYRVNGYPERALELFLRAESASPAGLEAYLLAADVQKVLGKTADVEKTEKLISDTFFPSPRLTAYLAEARERQGMKDRVMAEYRRRLAENPDDLALRQILAQTYFWNGKKAEAIEEYRHILANHEHRAFKDLEQRWSDLLLAMDRSYLLSDYLALAPEAAAKARAAIDGQAARVKNALSARQADDKAFQAARAEAEKRAEAGAKPEERARAEAAVQQAQDKLAAAEASLSTEEAALAARSAEARAVAAGFANALSLVSAGSESLSVLRQKDAAEQRTFSGLTKGNRWTWDRGGAIAELQRDAAHDPLSRLVLAKLYLSARNAAAAQSLLAPADSASDAGLGERL
jgi:Flp pilus assembly protein TadD